MTNRRYSVFNLFICAILISTPLAITSIVYADSKKLEFNRDIRPILSSHCFDCHGPDNGHREANLRLDTFEGATADEKKHPKLAPESGYAAIVPGNPDESELMLRLRSDDRTEKMPPPKHARPELKKEEIETLHTWIKQGASYQKHWAFEKPRQQTPPKVNDPGWINNTIDTFVLARLEEQGMKPNDAATREQLLRRVTLDLTGLPPKIEAIDAFLNDKSEKAYQKVIDGLLASPHYGERMAIPWLDAARYADTNGFSIDDHRDMWLWREWVINAFNQNMPYDQFLTEQLAGDLLPDATDQQRLATGFLRNSMNTHEGGTIPEEYRVIYIADKIDTVATVFMGLTVRCAQCHDHKYDPISQRDYYNLYAFFDTAHEPGKGAINGNTKPIIRTDGPLTPPDLFKQDLNKRIATLKQYLIHPPELVKARAKWEQTAKKNSKDKLAAALKTPHLKRNSQQWQTINSAFAKTTKLWGRHINTIKREIEVLQKDKKAGKSSVMVMKEQGPRQTYLLTRGQYDQPDKKQPCNPDVPKALPPLASDTKSPTRLSLARWLTQKDHPLTARVIVNRYWQMLFGRGLVATPDDLGSQGSFPSHPQLLDWLAYEYAHSGWDTKKLIKTIVLSATYQQSSRVSRKAYEHDPANRYLARASRFRLPAEILRDSALAISGSLNKRIGGPSVYPPQPDGLWREISHFGYPKAFSAQAFYPSQTAGQFRRSMYTFWKRTSPPPAMTAFDAPSREVCSVTRSRTNTPLQALILLNDPEYVRAAKGLASLAIQKHDTPESRLQFIFRRATSRLPQDWEARLLLKRLDKALSIYQSQVSENKAEHAAWTVVASTILNLDEVITRE